MDPKTSDEPNVDLYTIPSHSSWFSWADIHETERKNLREFFEGASITRTPKIYKEYRDFIISKYRECPSRRLSFTEARKSLVGDVSLLLKVFRFLDSNGLINFGATAAEKEETEGEEKVRMEEGMPVGIRVVTVPNVKAAILTPPPGGIGRRTVAKGSLFTPLASYKDVYGDTNEAVCRHCKKRCGSAYYQCVKEGVFRVCIKCFNNGNYGKDNSIDDFKLIGDISNSENYNSVWTEAETLLLLESVLKNGDDWDLVVENVKTKNKADCISKLIQLPFGDHMLGSTYGRGKSSDIGLNRSKKLTSSEPNSVENMETENQCPNVENATKKNGNAEAEKQSSPAIESKDGNSEIEFKKNVNSEIESKENGNSGIESKGNENADIESKENENIETESKENLNAENENKENEVVEIESKENENVQIESKMNENVEIESKENENAEIESKENLIAEFESKGNENAELESKDNKKAEMESKENETAGTKENQDAKVEEKDSRNDANQVRPLKRKRTSLSSDASSSLMKQIAFLSSVVDPRITACAAEAAISALCGEIQCPREVFDGNDTEDEDLGTSPKGNKGSEVDGMDIDGRPTTESQETSVEKNDLPLSLQMRVATATALGAAAARAKLLADQEDREIETLVANIIETQMKKVQYKGKYFDDMELLMEKEYTELEDPKESITVERMNVLQCTFKAKSGFKGSKSGKISGSSDVI